MINKSIRVGIPTPLVGVFSTVRLSSKNGLPDGKEARVFVEQIAMAKQYGITTFLFFGNGVNWSTRTINGYTFISGTGKTGRWIRKTFPFPEVVYNRIRSRIIERQLAIKRLLEQFEQDPNIQLVNARFLDKWEVYEALAKDPLTSAMLPPTRLLSSANLQCLLDANSEVFIKPRNNNAGRGIIKVVRNTSKIYSYCRAESSSPQWKKCTSFNNLWNQISIGIRNSGNYLVQTGIELAKLEGRVFDLRAQVQKDGNGQWVFTGVTVRIAAKNRFVTYDKYSVKKSVSFAKVMAKVSRRSETTKDKIKSQLEDLYNCVPRVLEKALGLSLAVLSIDIGLDVNGKVWIIEVSSKSDSFDEDVIRARHFRYLMEYFIYITQNTAGKI